MTWPEEARRATISVAMCVYNGARYLSQQLDTIAAQTRQPFELVIADDCSTDGTIELIEKFAATSNFPVRLYQNKIQLGSTANFDQTIRLCRGDYIALSDQDDRWRPEKLARLGEMLDQDPTAGMVFSDASLIDDHSRPTGRMLWQSFGFLDAVRMRFAQHPGSVLLERPRVTGATMMFRRALLERFSAIPSAWVHDGWITWMSVLWSKPLFTPETLTEYRVHASQQLGVGAVSLIGRLAEIRNEQRAIVTELAEQLDLLQNYVRDAPELGPREHWLGQIGSAVSFFRMRAEAPTPYHARIPYLKRNLSLYRNMSVPVWRMLLRDLLMGSTKAD